MEKRRNQKTYGETSVCRHSGLQNDVTSSGDLYGRIQRSGQRTDQSQNQKNKFVFDFVTDFVGNLTFRIWHLTPEVNHPLYMPTCRIHSICHQPFDQKSLTTIPSLHRLLTFLVNNITLQNSQELYLNTLNRIDLSKQQTAK